MATLFRVLAVLIAFVTAPLPAAAQDVFDEAQALRNALLQRDVPWLKSLDMNGDVFTEDTLKFLFDPASMNRIGAGIRPLRDIVAAAPPTPLVARKIIDGQTVYLLHWSVPDPHGAVLIDSRQWMKSVAVCAITQDAKGRWGFYRHVCFDETEGPFERGSTE